MRCTGFCTAGRYDIARLLQALEMTGSCQLHHGVLFFQPEDGKGKKGVFYFPYGVSVFWGFAEEEENLYVAALKKCEHASLDHVEFDEFSFRYGEMVKIQDDQIVLSKKDPLLKLAIGYAISQSLKLTVFEEKISRSVEESNRIPQELARHGKIALSRRDASRKMGEIFLERNYVNLQSEILDSPDFFWDHVDLEPPYRNMISYLDVTKRADALNRRLTLLHELFEILGNELNHQHTTRLELTIVILIVIEVILALLHDFFHLF
jgi:uncharacterized Rmd1/YagE family protein